MRTDSSRSREFLLALILLVLTACGGGGGGGGAPPPPSPPPTASTPTISTQPSSQSAATGSSVTFTVAATGNGTLTYQWRLNSTAISGATSATLSVSVTTASAGSYDCVITDTLSGTTASATSSAATLTAVTAPTTAVITGETAVLPNSGSHVVSIPAQSGVTYTWSVTNGTITSGQGTAQITYTAGALGRIQVAVVVANIAGGVAAVQKVVAVASLPITSLFAQQSVLVGTTNVLASSPATGGNFAWILAPGPTTATPGPTATANQYSYDAGTTVGSYQLTVNTADTLGHTGSATHSYNVVRNTFVGDVRDVTPRTLHTATLMNDGRVLVVGGDAGIPSVNNPLPTPGSQSNIVASAEVFDLATQTWAFVSSLPAPRFEHSATLLNDGRVLVAGGADASGNYLSSVEIYDPGTQTWSAVAAMSSARALHSATLLADGRVLVAGGYNTNGVLAAAEVYDPTADAWSPAGTMTGPRVLQSATLLPNGQVLVAGGLPGSSGPATILSSAERYDPTQNTWTAAASMAEPEYAKGAVLLLSGKVLQLGALAELYDPVADSWTNSVPPSTSNFIPLAGATGTTAVLLPDGRVLAAGGYILPATAAVYDPIAQSWTAANYNTGSFTSVAPLPDGTVLVVGGMKFSLSSADPSQANTIPSAALAGPVNSTSLGSNSHAGAYAAVSSLTDGRVMVTGGSISRAAESVTATAGADLFNPTTNTWAPAASMSTARAQHVQTTLANGSVLVTGGSDGFLTLRSSAELYTPSTNTWTSAGAMSSARYQHTATLLADGKVLVAGGSNQPDQPSGCSCTTYLAAADLYDPTSNTWTAAGAMVTARYGHTATLLNNGKVLVAGGFGGPTSTLQNLGAVLASAEIYDPTAGTWSATAPMNSTRIGHTATLLASGKVLVTGGTDGTNTLSSAEIYDPPSNTWTAVASLLTPRQSHMAQILPSGNVLVVGGLNDSSSAVFGVSSAEVYDPVANTWSVAGSMVTPRQHFIVSGLSDGRVLLEGGTPNSTGLPEFYYQ